MEIRALDDRHLRTVQDLLTRAFGRRPRELWDRQAELTRGARAEGRQLGAFEGDRLVAVAMIHDMTQWWHGRPVSMGGIAGVAVAPEVRGRGVGRALVSGVLERCAAFGHALSTLYPATTPLYRSLGWEHAGSLHRTEFPAEALRTIAADPVEVRRATPRDAAEVARVIGRVHREAGHCGPVGWGEERWRAFLDDDESWFYLAEDGFLHYGWGEGNTLLEVKTLVAASQRTLRAFWSMVGSGSSMAETVRAGVAPDDPVFWLTPGRMTEDLRRIRWMLRVVDARKAIADRGMPAGVTAEIPLTIDDPRLGANAGSWMLAVKDGEGRLERSGEIPGAVRIGAGGLAALYSGVPTSTLRRAGLMDGDAPELDAVFAASPFTLDFF